MDGDNSSVISLSSTSSEGSSESLASIVTVSSDTQRVPVSWESGRKKSQILDSNSPPSHAEKVKDWMNSCEYQTKSCDSPEDSSDKEKSTCIRYDFNKSPRTASIPKSCFTRTTPLFSYMEEAKKNHPVSETHGTRSKSVGPHSYSSSEDDNPDTQKKELCSYLQLTKPDDDGGFFVEHRRSGRVRNQIHNVGKDKPKKETTGTKSEVNYPISKLHSTQTKSLKRKNSNKELPNKYLPLPPKRIYKDICDFEESVKEIVEMFKPMEKNDINDQKISSDKKSRTNGCLKKVEKRRKFKIGVKKFRKGQFTGKRFLALRSRGQPKNTSRDTLIKKNHMKRKARKKLLKEFKEKVLKEHAKKSEITRSPQCEIISVHTNSDDENVDLKNFVDDMLELDKMSEEHRQSVIETRILARSSLTNLINKKAAKEADVQKAYKIFSEISSERKSSEEKENTHDSNIMKTDKDDEASEDKVATTDLEKNANSLVTELIISEHDYANFSGEPSVEENDDEETDDEVSVGNSLSPVPISDLEVLPVSTKGIELKSLHRSLTLNKRKPFLNNYGLHGWNTGPNSDNRKLNHSISISLKDGAVLRAFYQDFNLVIAQHNSISFWTQSALGNVLGAQNMWIPKGKVQRIPLNGTYTQKSAIDVVITTETSIAYVELWTKEHKSDVRELPVADVFATVYFWRVRQSGLEKKALQLENIKGFSEDVQYCVLKYYPKIIVSWHSIQGGEKKTKIHSYHLAADFQTVASISEIQPVQHYVSSLHNIEDCDSMVMGYGENKVTLWNVEYGYIVATIEMSSIESPLSTLWVKCDRGFLFIIQECADHDLRLIAVNGMNHSWKKLQNYSPMQDFDSLKGVSIENGILVAYYSQGMLGWNAQTGELIEEVPNEGVSIPSGKYVIMIVNENIIVRNSLCNLIT